MAETDGVKQHVSMLGVLYIVFGVLGLLCAVTVLLLMGGVAGIASLVAQEEPDAAIAVPILGAIGIGVFAIISLLSAPALAVGIGLIKMKSWARILGLIVSMINLLNFPFGTVLGAYGLWVLLKKETEALFTGG